MSSQDGMIMGADIHHVEIVLQERNQRTIPWQRFNRLCHGLPVFCCIASDKWTIRYRIGFSQAGAAAQAGHACQHHDNACYLR